MYFTAINHNLTILSMKLLKNKNNILSIIGKGIVILNLLISIIWGFTMVYAACTHNPQYSIISYDGNVEVLHLVGIFISWSILFFSPSLVLISIFLLVKLIIFKVKNKKNATDG